MKRNEPRILSSGISRRKFVWGGLAAGAIAASGYSVWRALGASGTAAFIGKVPGYSGDIGSVIRLGLRELGITELQIKGKSILLKPNLVETLVGAGHINTHPLVVRAAAEAFLALGAGRVLVAEGSGHSRDTLLVVEESGLADVLAEDRIPFVDLNYDDAVNVPNRGAYTKLPALTLPATLRDIDLVVSMAKMKTHHWAGVTLSMKNMFGIMPGFFYGWPKNILHWAGIDDSILDINTALQSWPQLAIVDGIVGMEGDGPIMGTPKQAGVLVMGRNFPAADATCARIMGIDPQKVPYLAKADRKLGPLAERHIQQRGEAIRAVRTDFALVSEIPAHQGLRLG